MSHLTMLAGTTSKIIMFSAYDSSSTIGAKLAGLVYNSASLTAYYSREGVTGAATAIILVTATKGTWTSSGFIAVDGTNMPGDYELHIPNEALASGAKSVMIQVKGATNLVPVNILIELTAVNNQDAVRFGLTAIPNAAAEATGGLYTRGTGSGQINQPANGRVDVNTIAIGGTAQTGRDLGTSVLLSTGTGTGQLDFTSGVVKSSLVQILGTAISGTASQISAAFTKFFDKATPTGTINSLPDAVAGATNGLFIAGTNAATTVTTGLTTTFTGNLTGSVNSVTGLTAATVHSDLDDIQARLPAALTANGNMKSSLVEILTTALTETVGQIAAAFKQFFDVGTPTGTMKAITNVVTTTNLTTNNDKTGYALTQSFPTNFSALSITAGGLVDITQTAADKAWSTAARLLTAGTNIVLAKGVGITGFNDILATDVWSAVTRTITGNGDKTGYSLTQAFPTNFADLAITVTTGRVTVGTNSDKTGYTASTVSDKTGYSLSSPQAFDLTGNITGNLSGSTGSVTSGVAVTTNNDKTGYALTQAFPTNFSSLSITAGGLVDIVQGAADKVWLSASRLLTAGTNIILTKGVGLLGLNDITAADVWAAGARTLTSFGTLIVDIWSSATVGMVTVGSMGKKLADWVLGTDSKVLLSTDAQAGVTIPTVTTLTNNVTVGAFASTLSSPGVKKNTILNNFEFYMIDSADHVSGKVGLAVTATRSIDGAAFGACANAVTEVANGVYKINLAAADVNGDVITLKLTAVGADATLITILTKA